MPNAWDAPPMPPRGDDDINETYRGVGYALSQWEWLEYHLSHLYSQLLGTPALISTMRRYGKPRVFAKRLTALQAVAQTYFMERPSQALESEADALWERLAGFANRRNEIAHGVVLPLYMIHPPLPQYETVSAERHQYALAPPLCTDKKLDASHRPIYIYTASELERFALAFHELSGEALRLKIEIARA